MAAIHGDTLLGSADELLGWVRRADALSPAAAALRDRLLAWDRHMDAGQRRRGGVRRLADRGRGAAHRAPGLAPLHAPHGRGALLDPWLGVGPRVADALSRLLGAAAIGIDGVAVTRAALERVASCRGRDLGRSPPAPAGPDPARLPRSGRRPVPLSGDTDCVRCTASVPGVSDRSWRGSVARWVWDLGDRRRSRWGVPFGASEDPASPHATDQLATWAAAQTVEVVTDWDLLEEETR